MRWHVIGLVADAALNVGPNVQVGLRYTHGLAAVANSTTSDLLLGGSKNRCVQLYVGFGFGG